MLKFPPKLSVLFIAAEAEPFVRVGGLGDVSGALPHALRRICQANGHEAQIDIRLAIPYYGCISTTGVEVEKIADFSVQSTSGPEIAHVFMTHSQGLPVYLIGGDPIHRDSPVYSKDFESDAEKFVFFSLACTQLPAEIGWPIDILHANDWHTAIALHQIKQLHSKKSAYAGIQKILSIHNLPFMGTGSEKALKHYRVKPAVNPNLPVWARSLPLPMGMDAADEILTVSPRYAEEIQTPVFGCDLQEYIKTRKEHLRGIVNGLDTTVWNPQTDTLISQNYSFDSLDKRAENKTALQRELGLPVDSKIPLLTYVGRMDHQKGVDLLLDVLGKIKSVNWQAVILGTGHKDLEEAALLLQQKYPDRVKAITRFDTALSHRIYAGADALAMPSRYEPCGLSQLIAMRYGCIPIVSATGGLVDTVIPVDDKRDGTGFLFKANETSELRNMLRFAASIYADPSAWRKIQISAMKKDYSWDRSAQEYADLYFLCVENH